MVSRLNPYLSFRGKAREAMEFYRSVFGGDLTVTTFGDGQMAQDPADRDLVMHAQLMAPNGFVLMGSDMSSGMEYRPGNTITVSLSGDDDADLNNYWTKLADGGSGTYPLAKAPWGDSFGMLTDKFGASRMINIAGTPQQ